MRHREFDKPGEGLDLPPLTAVIEREGAWFISKCPELGVASQGRTQKQAYAMLAEAVQLWLEDASLKEITRRV